MFAFIGFGESLMVLVLAFKVWDSESGVEVFVINIHVRVFVKHLVLIQWLWIRG